MSKVVTLCPADDVWEGAIHGAALPGGHKVALFRLGDEVFALDDTCTHEDASLSEDGCVVGDRVECGWHNRGSPCCTGCGRGGEQGLPTSNEAEGDSGLRIVPGQGLANT